LGVAGKILAVLGSARRQSDTEKLLHILLNDVVYTRLDLLHYNIAPYAYNGSYPENDNFSDVVTALLQHDTIIWATPVYWYAMSGLLKTCFDRLTDLVTFRKALGRKLKGKNTFLVAVGADAELPEGFIIPFKSTAAYLNMHFGYYFYAATSNLHHVDLLHSQAKTFIANIMATKNQPDK